MSSPSDSRGYYSGDLSRGYGGYAPQSPRNDDSLLPRYLAVAVVLLGFASYLVSFGPVFDDGALPWGVRLAVLAGVLTALDLLSRQTSAGKFAAALATLGFLDALATLLTAPAATEPGWALTVIVVINGLQMAAAVALLFLGSGVVTERDTRSEYEAYADYYAQMAYYGHYQQSNYPEEQHSGGQGHAQGHAASRAQRIGETQAGSYSDFIGNQHSEPTAKIGPPPSTSHPQAGLPSFGHAQAPANRPGEGSGAQFRPSSPQ